MPKGKPTIWGIFRAGILGDGLFKQPWDFGGALSPRGWQIGQRAAAGGGQLETQRVQLGERSHPIAVRACHPSPQRHRETRCFQQGDN